MHLGLGRYVHSFLDVGIIYLESIKFIPHNNKSLILVGDQIYTHEINSYIITISILLSFVHFSM